MTIAIQGLLNVGGIRFIFSSFVLNFQGFGVVAVTFIAMLGAGAAEGAGMMEALIRKLVKTAPRSLITFLIVLVGALSSVASDAGYLVLIPLAAAVFYFIVTIAQRYQKDSGIGSVIAQMLPYAVIMGIFWVILFVVWFLAGIPLGPGYPAKLGQKCSAKTDALGDALTSPI